MREEGWEDVDVVLIDVDAQQARALAVLLNRSGELASWDLERLRGLLSVFVDEEIGLETLGFDDADIESLLGEDPFGESGGGGEGDGDTEEPDDGDIQPPEASMVEPGDVWILGEHRLLCGDSTDPDVVDRLMRGEKAALVATDPPYLVDYTGERPRGSGKDWSATYKEVEIGDAEPFFRAVFECVKRVLAPHAAVYCWHAHKRHAVISRIWEELGFLDHQQIIWVKPTPVFGRVYWHFRHEPCMMGWLKGSKPPHDGNHEFDSVWEVDWEGKARVVGNEHPMQKPLELFARPMRKHTEAGDLCFEPFSGSGSQLLAAEQLGRRCLAIEIEPRFVEVALERWARITGRQPVLESTGEELAAVRERRTAVTAEAAS
jgi:DNA modification methylase